MDDIFFSDKPDQHTDKRKLNQSDFQPEDSGVNAYSGNPLNDGDKQKFVVQLPDHEKPVVLRDRTPKGQPVLTPSVQPKVPDYTPSQTSRFDDSVYLRPTQPEKQPSMQHRPPQPKPAVSAAPRGKPMDSRVIVSKKQAAKRKKRRSKGKIVCAVLLVLVLILTGLFAYGYSILGKVSFDKEFSHENAYIDSSALAFSPKVRNILCIGSDARSEIGGQRSDTMVLLSIDSAHHQLKMTSFLRDSYVYIPEKGYHAKLNAAFAWGGAKMLVDTIEYNFKVRIDDYVIIDFEGFQKLIDLMGGLDVDGVTEAEAKYMRDVVKIVYCKEGKNHFTGAAALWYCRIRKLDDDFHRTERQRKVIIAIMKQALHRNPFELMKIIEQVLPMVQTSLSRNDLVAVGFSTVFNYIGGKKPQTQVPAENTWTAQRINGQDVLRLDFDENIKLLKQFLYEKA